MTYWLWSLPPAHLSAYVRTGTFALRRRRARTARAASA